MEAENLKIIYKADKAGKQGLLRTIRELQRKTGRLEKELQELKESLAVCLAAVGFAAKDATAVDVAAAGSGGLEEEEKGAAAAAVQAQTPSDKLPAMDSLLKELGCIDDLSLSRGLARANRDKKVYVNLLRQFCQNADKDVKILTSAAQRSDWDGYLMQAQTLKGIFENVGNQFLADWAADLEQAAGKGDVKKCRRQTRPFCDNLRSFRTRLLEAALMDKPEDADNLHKKLEALATACLECDAAGVDVITGELKAATLSEEGSRLLKEICDLAGSFDYDDIIVKCGLLRETLPN
jgi:HPt (histidine-containing phosphotransfer) domain-containing protein